MMVTVPWLWGRVDQGRNPALPSPSHSATRGKVASLPESQSLEYSFESWPAELWLWAEPQECNQASSRGRLQRPLDWETTRGSQPRSGRVTGTPRSSTHFLRAAGQACLSHAGWSPVSDACDSSISVTACPFLQHVSSSTVARVRAAHPSWDFTPDAGAASAQAQGALRGGLPPPSAWGTPWGGRPLLPAQGALQDRAGLATPAPQYPEQM